MSEFFQKALVTLEEIHKTVDKYAYDGDYDTPQIGRVLLKIEDMICDIEEMMEGEE